MEVFAVITVADESMSGSDILTAVQHGPIGVNLGFHEVVPILLGGDFGAFLIADSGVITEIS